MLANIWGHCSIRLTGSLKSRSRVTWCWRLRYTECWTAKLHCTTRCFYVPMQAHKQPLRSCRYQIIPKFTSLPDRDGRQDAQACYHDSHLHKEPPCLTPYLFTDLEAETDSSSFPSFLRLLLQLIDLLLVILLLFVRESTSTLAQLPAYYQVYHPPEEILSLDFPLRPVSRREVGSEPARPCVLLYTEPISPRAARNSKLIR